MCRYLEDLAGDYHRFYDSPAGCCRKATGGTDLHRARLALCEATRQVIANGLGSSALRPGADVSVHPPDRGTPRRSTTAMPAEAAECRRICSALSPKVGRATSFAATTAWCGWPGVAVTELAETYGTPLFVVDEDDFRSRCRRWRTRSAAVTKFTTPPRRSCAPRSPGGWPRRGLPRCRQWRRAGGRLHAGFPAERIALHGNNKSVDELTAAVNAGIGTSCWTR